MLSAAPLPLVPLPERSARNNSSVALAAGGTFIGQPEAVTPFESLTVFVAGDAPGSFVLQFAADPDDFADPTLTTQVLALTLATRSALFGRRPDGSFLPVAITDAGRLGVDVVFPAALPSRFATSYRHLATNGTVILKAAPGKLRAVTINTDASNTNTVSLLDGAAVIAVLKGAVQGTYRYDVAFSTLTIVSATGTAPDMTVSWD